MGIGLTDIPSSFVIVHEKLEKQEKKQEIQDEEVEEQEKALEKQLTAKGSMPVSDQIAVFAVDVNKKKEEFMPTKSKKRNKGWSAQLNQIAKTRPKLNFENS